MEVSRFNLLFHLFILISIFSIFSICKSEDADCVYTVYIKTGTELWAGTDSTISLTLSDAYGKGARANDLVSWGGLMGPHHDYFENGNLDIFSGKGPCLSGPVCEMNLTSDGSGSHPGWYVDYVEVTTIWLNNDCAKQNFTVGQWLDYKQLPNSLTAIRNNCHPDDEKRLIFNDSDSSEVSIIDNPNFSEVSVM